MTDAPQPDVTRNDAAPADAVLDVAASDDAASDDATRVTATTAAMRWSTRAIALLIIGAAVLAAAVFLLGRATAPTAVTPSTTSAEAGFARDMQTHHLQAVQLSALVRERSDDAAIRLLAFDIATTQQQQAGQMYGWLTVWGLPQASPEPEMTWMTRPTLEGVAGHDHGSSGAGPDAAHVPGEPMPGFATAEQLDELRAADGVEAERIFLELMIEHHVGGVDMAEAVLDRSEHRVVTGFATAMIKAQLSEIVYMEGLLAARS